MTDDREMNLDFDDAAIRQWANQIRTMKINELRQAVRKKQLMVKGAAGLTNSSLPQFMEEYGKDVDELCELTKKLYLLEHESKITC